MAIKKTELYSSLWASCDELRGGMDASQYEDAARRTGIFMVNASQDIHKIVDVFTQYPKLTENEIKTLVVDDKWHATLKAAISAEIGRVTQQLANRVKVLEERYAEPLPELVQAVERLSSRVEEHLRKMGLEWG